MAMPKFEHHPEHLKAIMNAAIAAADPCAAVKDYWPEQLNQARRVHIIAVGKASLGMAQGAYDMLGNRLVGGVVVAVPELIEACSNDLPGLEILAADHPLPTQRNIEAATAVAKLAAQLDQNDTLLVLLSGGGSAHLTLPAKGLSLEDLRAVTHDLLKAGAPIGDLNCVRKHCEQLKGGGFGQLAARAQLWTLALSDVIGNNPDIIASGPTVPDSTTSNDALATLIHHGLINKHPAIAAHLNRDTANTASQPHTNANYRIIGSNTTALLAAMDQAERLGFTIAGFESDQTGQASPQGQNLARHALKLQADQSTPTCHTIGGETTVNVQNAQGSGGPCQELALAAAIELSGTQGIAIAALTTDGIDGPTDAAGAIITGKTALIAQNQGFDPAAALKNHDSHTLLNATESLIRTGPTGTNVNDLALALVYELVS